LRSHLRAPPGFCRTPAAHATEEVSWGGEGVGRWCWV